MERSLCIAAFGGSGRASSRVSRGILALVLGLSLAGDSSADILWSWSFDTEAGTILTGGDLVGGVALPATYDLLDFTVTQSVDPDALGSLGGGTWNEGSQPGQGFVWDGTAPTQWFRANGAATNGMNMYHATEDLRYVFNVGSYALSDQFVDNVFASSAEIDLHPVPEPPAGWLMACGLGLALASRRVAPGR